MTMAQRWPMTMAQRRPPLLVLMLVGAAVLRGAAASCAANPCEHDAYCEDQSDGSYVCRCGQRWIGENCQYVAMPTCMCPPGLAVCSLTDLVVCESCCPTLIDWGGCDDADLAPPDPSFECAVDGAGHLDAALQILLNDDVQTVDFDGLVSARALRVRGCASLQSLELVDLAHVGMLGTLDTYLDNGMRFPALRRADQIVVDNNDNLLDVDFSSLETVSRELRIEDNQVLTALMLPNLRTVGSVDDEAYTENGLHFLQNNAVSAVDLSALQIVYGTLAIADCFVTTSIQLSSLQRVLNDFEFQSNNAVTSLDLSSLFSVENTALIYSNTALVELDLSRLSHVVNQFGVTNNAASITTALPCKAKPIKKLQPQGAVHYRNPFHTMCHQNTLYLPPVGAFNQDCNECEEYSREACVSGEGACARCDLGSSRAALGDGSSRQMVRLEVLDAHCQDELRICRAIAECLAQLQLSLVCDEPADCVSMEEVPPADVPVDDDPNFLVLLGCHGRNYIASDTRMETFVESLPPVIKDGYVRFSPSGQTQGGQATHVYPCRHDLLGYRNSWECRPSVSCFCPLDLAVCDVATELLDPDGNAGTDACTPNHNVLEADVYVYANDAVQTVDFADIRHVSGSIVVVSDAVVSAPSLVSVNGSLVIRSRIRPDFSAPNLEVVSGELLLSFEGQLDTLTLPKLSKVDGALVASFSDSDITTVMMPSLTHVEGYIDIDSGCLSTLDLGRLHEVVGTFTIYGVCDTTSQLTISFPCSAPASWDSQAQGTKERRPSVAVECHAGPNTVAASEGCAVCDECVECDGNHDPVVLAGYVRVVGLDRGDDTVHILECENDAGCHGEDDTGEPVATCSRTFDGHLCQSCADGYHMDQSDGDFYCTECKAADVVFSVVLLVVAGLLLLLAGLALRRKAQELSEASQAEIQAMLAVFRSVWVPVRIMITYSQISAQMKAVLNVRFAEGYVVMMRRATAIFNVVDVVVSSECVGLGHFVYKWLKDIVLQPGLLVLVVFIYYLHQRKNAEHALQTLVANTFYVFFFCYPQICSTSFATFICSNVFDVNDASGGGHRRSVLVADDRVVCEASGHRALQMVTYVIVVVIAFGVPFSAAAFLRYALGRQPLPDKRLQHRVASDFNLDRLSQATDLIQDIGASSKYGFLVGSYRSSVYYWESVDMGRKLLLCGLVLLFDRGSIFQLMAALFVASGFAFAQAIVNPYKLMPDNALRLSTELHNIISIGIAVLLKTDKAAADRRAAYDVLMLSTFVVLVAVPFVIAVVVKLVSIRQTMQGSLTGVDAFGRLFNCLERITGCDLDGDGDVGAIGSTVTGIKAGGRTQDDQDSEDLQMVVKRFELGLQSNNDRKVFQAYLDQPTVGQKLWHEKQAAAHLTIDEMQATIDHLEAQLPKSQALGLHFTDLDSAHLILSSIGIRASTVGQLSGGVSICLASMRDLGWGSQFEILVGEALWGSKSHEVLSGPPPPGAPQSYGKYSKKLECVLLVRVPSAENRDPRRILPGRPYVYILPQTACVEDDDGQHYLRNEDILSCFILKQPEEKEDRDTIRLIAQQRGNSTGGGRIVCTSSRDDKGGMSEVHFAESPEVKDSIDNESGFPPHVLSCMLTVAAMPTGDRTEAIVKRHRDVEAKAKNCEHWLEDVERFTEMEMEAALYSMDQGLARDHTLAYHFTSRAASDAICAPGGGLAALEESADGNSGSGIVFCVQSPVELGWQAHAGGDFQARLQRLWWGDQLAAAHADIEVMVVLAVPTVVFEDVQNKCARSDGLWTLPSELLTESGVYSNVHVQKCYVVISEASRLAAVTEVAPVTQPSEAETPMTQPHVVTGAVGVDGPKEPESPAQQDASATGGSSATARMTKSKLRALVSEHASPGEEEGVPSSPTQAP